MRKPILAVWNDVHLKTGNEDQILRAFKFMIQKLNDNGITRTIFAGDLFDSRTFQRLKVLNTFDKMLALANENGIHIDCIPGNHDKTLYSSYDSFLDIYSHYPNFTLHRGVSDIEIGGVGITLIPFFSEEMLIPMLKEHGGNDVLISHFEMQGSTHLGKTVEKSIINKKLMSKWDKVYLGHYHNWHEISKDIVHMPSFIQQSFGEDSKKGFTILFDDLSYDIIKGLFDEFRKIQVDLDSMSPKSVKELIRTYENSSDRVRFEVVGSESKVKAFDTSIFKGTGIDVKKKYEQKFEFNENDENIPQVIEKFDKALIQDSFRGFCEDKGYDYKEGKAILDKFLNQ